MKRQLGVGDKEPEKPAPAPAVPDLEKFAQLLQSHKHIVKVKRLRPKMWHGQKASVEVWTSELPLQWEEIKSEVQQSSGGGTYKVSVVDPQSGSVIDAQNFEGEGDPILEVHDLTPEEKAMFANTEKDAATLSEEALERRARVTAKMVEVEALEHQLEEARTRRNGGGDKKSNADESRIDDLERRLTEAKHQAEIEKRDREHKEELKELRDLIAAQNKPQPVPQGPSEITMLIAQMQKAQESSDKRFEALQKQMQDDKLNAMLDEIKAIKNKPQQSGLLENVQVMLQMKKLMGWGDDDPDDDDPDDDRPWYERALEKLGDKLGDKFIPKLIDKLDGLEASGKKITTREDFLREIGPEIDAFAKEVADKELSKRNLEVSKPAALPAPTPPVQSEAPSAPAAAAPTSAAPVPAPAPAIPTVEQRICQMAAGAVAMIESEIQIRPNNAEWYWNLWDELPQPILEKVCQSQTPVEMFDAFKVEGLNHAEIDAIKAKIAADSKIVAWLAEGFLELKRWWEEKKKDPAFDPEEEDDN